jgi:hypothetical protein
MAQFLCVNISNIKQACSFNEILSRSTVSVYTEKRWHAVGKKMISGKRNVTVKSSVRYVDIYLKAT